MAIISKQDSTWNIIINSQVVAVSLSLKDAIKDSYIIVKSLVNH